MKADFPGSGTPLSGVQTFLHLSRGFVADFSTPGYFLATFQVEDHSKRRTASWNFTRIARKGLNLSLAFLKLLIATQPEYACAGTGRNHCR